MGAAVLGVETDADWINVKGSTAGLGGVCAADGGGPCQTQQSWVGTTRARVGYAFDRWLPYVTGGVSWAKTDFSVGSRDFGETHVGWTAGAGLEWAIAGNWTAKVEYLYLGLGSKSYKGVDIDLDGHTARLGVNYRF